MRNDLQPTTIKTAEARILEEIGEVLQAYGKRERFGIHATDPKTRLTYDNQVDFEMELRDLRGAIALYFSLKAKDANH